MFIDFRERGRERERVVGGERERERERNMDVREKHCSLASQMCPDWDWNPQPVDVLDTSPTN